MIPLTPFEVFRTPLTLYRLQGGHYVEGRWVEGISFTVSSNLISGQTITIGLQIEFSLNHFAQAFVTSQANTMALLKAQILLNPGVAAVFISSDNLTMTLVQSPGYLGFSIFSGVVTGSGSLPTVTWLNSPEVLTITASIQPTTGEDMQMVPEARRNQKTYKLYTSFFVKTVEAQNPDQIIIFNERYELMQVSPWQNNANFRIVNHYKFIAMILDPLTPIIGT